MKRQGADNAMRQEWEAEGMPRRLMRLSGKSTGHMTGGEEKIASKPSGDGYREAD